jgi:hypothetical protein
MMYDFGIEYFKYSCDGYSRALKAFERSKEMWNWWKQQYYIVDEGILETLSPGEVITLDLYRAFHLGFEYYCNEAIAEKAMDDYDKIVQNNILTNK